MTDPRTLREIGNQLQREYGQLSGMPTGLAAEMVGFAESLADERERSISRRNRWARPAWQFGRRQTPTNRRDA